MDDALATALRFASLSHMRGVINAHREWEEYSGGEDDIEPAQPDAIESINAAWDSQTVLDAWAAIGSPHDDTEYHLHAMAALNEELKCTR